MVKSHINPKIAQEGQKKRQIARLDVLYKLDFLFKQKEFISTIKQLNLINVTWEELEVYYLMLKNDESEKRSKSEWYNFLSKYIQKDIKKAEDPKSPSPREIKFIKTADKKYFMGKYHKRKKSVFKVLIEAKLLTPINEEPLIIKKGRRKIPLLVNDKLVTHYDVIQERSFLYLNEGEELTLEYQKDDLLRILDYYLHGKEPSNLDAKESDFKAFRGTSKAELTRSLNIYLNALDLPTLGLMSSLFYGKYADNIRFKNMLEVTKWINQKKQPSK